MKALGVKELGEFIKGEKDLKTALKLAKMHTRQYIKRQRTWLKGKLKPDILFDMVYDGQEEYVRRVASRIQE
jgi:tRNA dimethylallyltransferase